MRGFDPRANKGKQAKSVCTMVITVSQNNPEFIAFFSWRTCYVHRSAKAASWAGRGGCSEQ